MSRAFIYATLILMKDRRKFAPYLFIAILSFIGFILFINTFTPTTPVDLFGLLVPSVIPLLLLVFLIVSCVFAFILSHSRRGVFVGLFVFCFLVLQLIRYNNIFYTIILILIFVLLEYLFISRKNKD